MIYGICNGCKKVKFFVKLCRIYIEPMKVYATSKDPLCKKCTKIYQSIK